LASKGDAIALELAAGQYLKIAAGSGGLHLTITQLGIDTLVEETARDRVRRQPHHELGGRLAAWLREQRRITWENIELRVPVGAQGSVAYRPDVFSLVATYDETRLNPYVHEIKVSRSDFLQDVRNPEKRAGYAQLAEAVYYAAPAGMISVEEVPEECGLVVERELGKFEVLKRPKKRQLKLTAFTFMNLVLKPGMVASSD
jgi:hypothetical protein